MPLGKKAAELLAGGRVSQASALPQKNFILCANPRRQFPYLLAGGKVSRTCEWQAAYELDDGPRLASQQRDCR